MSEQLLIDPPPARKRVRRKAKKAAKARPIGQPLFVLEQVSKTFCSGTHEVNALRDVSIAIPKGSVTAIFGQSGSGKTTLLRLLGGLCSPDRGTVSHFPLHAPERIRYEDEQAMSEYRSRQIGWVFQDLNLISHLTVAQNAALPLVLKGLTWRDAEVNALRYLKELGLADRAGERPHRLSGGEQQRVAIARVLVARPSVILADEPTGSLDALNTTGVMEILRSVNKELGISIVMVTHEVGLLKEYCDFAFECRKLPNGNRIARMM